MSTAEFVLQEIRYGGSMIFGRKHVSFAIIVGLAMLLSLIYVWPRINMTELEYQLADQMSVRQKLLEERGRLKIDYATLKSPQRIETIAREKLQMTYPEREQVVYLK